MSDGYYGDGDGYYTGSGAPFEPQNETLPPEDEKPNRHSNSRFGWRNQPNNASRRVVKFIIILVFVSFLVEFILGMGVIVLSFLPDDVDHTDDLLALPTWADFDEEKFVNLQNNVQSELTGAARFNNNLEFFSGTQYGMMLPAFLDELATLIKKNPDHPVTVEYHGSLSSTAEEITALKRQFDHTATTKYEVVMDYDADGYIYRISILDY